MATCDLLLEHAIVVTMDEAFTVHPSGHVAVTGDAIVGVGAGTGD
jgi:5-methylthioadenosine/S-adenosylhomocysteine deaminase